MRRVGFGGATGTARRTSSNISGGSSGPLQSKRKEVCTKVKKGDGHSRPRARFLSMELLSRVILDNFIQLSPKFN